MNGGPLKPSLKSVLSPTLTPPAPPITFQSGRFKEENRITPSILLIIVILAVIFFVSGLLHLLVRFLLGHSSRDAEDLDDATALQGRLQQLFHLHDSGVDQSFIDSLPVFLYRAIVGLKNPFDCAVCLSEFQADDRLRLLPRCSHAFHLECIDTWLLSHSTCPLCRGNLISDYYPGGGSPPVVMFFNSAGENSRETAPIGEALAGSSSSRRNTNAQIESLPSGTDHSQEMLPVKLGKFRNVDASVGEENSSSSSSKVDGRRCFSMGSFEYVLDDSSALQVAVKPPAAAKKWKGKTPFGHRQAMSECGHSNREGFRGFDHASGEIHDNRGVTKRDSFSFSKTWLWSKREKPSSSSDMDGTSRRAFSFRLPLRNHGADAVGGKSKQSSFGVSDIDVSEWESHRSGLGLDVEFGSSNNLNSQASVPSFARRTLSWLLGRQNKVIHSYFTNQQ